MIANTPECGLCGLCGGSIISDSRVLTAAHCTIENYYTIVIAGAHEFSANEATQQRITVPSSHYRIHNAYNPLNLNNDVSVLILPSLLTLNQYVAKIELAQPSQGLFVNEQAIMSGWGVTDGGSTAARLRYVQRPVIANNVCAQYYTFLGLIIDSTLCVSTVGGQGTCNGDSGGPLTTSNGGVQIGVVSFVAAAGCAAGYPAGFARISSFRDWIIAQ